MPPAPFLTPLGWHSIAVQLSFPAGTGAGAGADAGWPGLLVLRYEPPGRADAAAGDVMVRPEHGSGPPGPGLSLPGSVVTVVLRAFLTATGAGALLWDVLPHHSYSAESGASERVAPLFGELAWPQPQPRDRTTAAAAPDGSLVAELLGSGAPPLVGPGVVWTVVPLAVLECARNVRPARPLVPTRAGTDGRVALSASGTSAELCVGNAFAGTADVRFPPHQKQNRSQNQSQNQLTVEVRLQGADALRVAGAAVEELVAVLVASVLRAPPRPGALCVHVWLLGDEAGGARARPHEPEERRPPFVRGAAHSVLDAAATLVEAGFAVCDALEFERPLDPRAVDALVLSGRQVLVEGTRAAGGGWPTRRLADLERATGARATAVRLTRAAAG